MFLLFVVVHVNFLCHCFLTVYRLYDVSCTIIILGFICLLYLLILYGNKIFGTLSRLFVGVNPHNKCRICTQANTQTGRLVYHSKGTRIHQLSFKGNAS